MRKVNRREFLGTAGISGVLLSMRKPSLGFPVLAQPGLDYEKLDPRTPSNFTKPLRLPSDQGMLGLFEPSANFTLTTKEINHELISGVTTKLWVYEVAQGGRTYLNPILKVRSGDRFRTSLKNELAEETIIHWHGLQVDWRNDGHPSYHAAPGGTYEYDFTVLNRAATYWYHPHHHGHTGKQVNNGLAGFLIVEDEDEINLQNALDLNLGETDIPLVIQDRRFSHDGSLEYVPHEANMETFSGFIGDVILVNLTVTPSMDVSRRIYRFRVLNGSNARPYRLAFLNESQPVPFHVIGNDGGLLDQPYRVSEVFLAPAERVDVLLDVRPFQEGDVVFLKSMPFDPMHQEHGGQHKQGHGGQSRLKEGEEFILVRLNVKTGGAYDRQVPAKLATITPINTATAKTKQFDLFTPGEHDHDFEPMKWYINGLTFALDEYPVSVTKNTIERWDILNYEISMPHPMHIHGFLFQVLERSNSPQQIRHLVIDDKGLLPTDKGWKDTVLVWPEERVRIAIDFSHPFSDEQKYLLHCHNLEHQDEGMMINYKVDEG